MQAGDVRVALDTAVRRHDGIAVSLLKARLDRINAEYDERRSLERRSRAAGAG
jgi:hypothetical protein